MTARLIPTATLTETADGFEVNVTWTGQPLDRPSTGGWLFDTKQELLANRLTAAINGGAVFKNPRVLTDVNGKTYVRADQTQFFHKRHMAKSLTAVGY